MQSQRLAMLAVALLLACAAAPASAVERESSVSLRPGQLHESACEACERLVESAEAYLADPKTQADVSSLIIDGVCTQLPQQIRDTCSQEVPQLVTAAVSSLQDVVVPRDVCGALGACDGAALQQLQGPVDCPICKMVVVTLVVRLKDPESRAQIEQNIKAACDNMSSDLKANCQRDVDQLFASLDALLSDVDPEGACEIFQFCDKSDAPHTPVPAAFTRLRALYTELPGVAGSDSCESCKTIISEAAALLQDPKTQIEIIDYARQGCAVLQDYKDECVNYVNVYGPTLINLVLSYLQPDTLCTQLGYCKAQQA